MERKVAIVTGASSGIGRQTAIALARKGCAVVLAARREELLDQLAAECRQRGGEAMVVPVDVSQWQQVKQLVERTVERFGRLDVMVNNAGYGHQARVHEIDDRDLREIFDVNFFGVFYGCKAAAEVMIRQKSGHIFNVSSVIGKRGTPFNGAYSASKFAVSGLTESMRVEMKPFGVRVTLVCPGLTRTEFFDKVRGGCGRSKSAFIRLRTMMDPRRVAEKVVASIGRNTPELIFTPGGKFLVLLAALCPRAADWLLGFYRDDLAGKAGD